MTCVQRMYSDMVFKLATQNCRRGSSLAELGKFCPILFSQCGTIIAFTTTDSTDTKVL